MISKDFKIDFENKRIYHNPTFAKASADAKALADRSAGKPKRSGVKHTVNELYSYLQNIFDEPENMKYEIPMEAKSKTEYLFINGWSIDKDALKYLKDGTLQSGIMNQEA